MPLLLGLLFTRSEVPGAVVNTEHIDLGDLSSVRECADRLLDQAPFDVVLNNAGEGGGRGEGKRWVGAEGRECAGHLLDQAPFDVVCNYAGEGWQGVGGVGRGDKGWGAKVRGGKGRECAGCLLDHAAFNEVLNNAGEAGERFARGGKGAESEKPPPGALPLQSCL